MSKGILQLIFSLLIGAVAATYCYGVYGTFENRWNYVVWDPAAHGWDGMRLALDIKHARPLKLLEHTNLLVLWPPLHSYLQIPYFLVLGMQFPSAVICSLTFLALLPAALTWFYQQLDGSWPGWLTLVGFSVTSPLMLGYGTMPMLEIFGAALTAYSAALFLRQSKWFPLSLALLFFLKYNYFIYLALAVLVFHWSKGTLHASWIRNRSTLQPFLVTFAIFALFAVLILVTGGFEIGGVSVRGIGNPAYFLFLGITVWAVWKRQHIAIWEKVRGTGWGWFVLPVFVWLIIPVPNRVKTIFSFAINRPLGGPEPRSIDYYVYYFEKLPLYFAHHWIAWLSIVILVGMAIVYRKRAEILFVIGLFVVPFLLMTLNQNKQERFLLTFVPALWILFAYAIARIPKTLLRYAASVAICITLAVSLDLNLVRETIRVQFATLRSRAPIHFLAERLSNTTDVRLVGATNDLNPAIIQYHSALQSDFTIEQHFRSEVERSPKTDLHIVCIDCEFPAELLRERRFQGGMVVRHYFLDTSDGAPYNPIQ